MSSEKAYAVPPLVGLTRSLTVLRVPTAASLPEFLLDGECFVRPDFDGRGLASLAPTVLRLLAPAMAVELPPLSASVLPEQLTRGVSNIVVVVADGLGHLQLQREAAAGNAPFVAELLRRAGQGDSAVSYSPITSVFPSTTVAALGSVNSGVTPAEHGLLAYQLYLDEFQTVAEMIRWGPVGRRGSFADPEFGAAPESFLWAETLYARLRRGGIARTFAVNPHYFAGTALTRMLHQQATYAGYISTSSLQPIVSRLLDESAEPTYIYAYWPTVDTIAHMVGPLTAEHSAEVAGFDFQLGRLVRQLPRRGDTLLLVTADHGHVDTSPERSVFFADHPELLAMLRVQPAGERRATYLYARPGLVADVAAYARERLRDVAAVMLREEAVAVGLFGPGPLSDRAAVRIGDVLLFPRSNLQLVPPAVPPADGSPLAPGPAFRGLHGGLTQDEALVPLLALRT